MLGPALAMDSVPWPVCFSLKFSSSNLCPYMDFPPVPSPRVKSPPCTMCRQLSNDDERDVYGMVDDK